MLADLITRVASGADDTFDAIRDKVRQRLNLTKPLQICAYRSFGSDNILHIRGRVLEDKGITDPDKTDNFLENMLNMYRRFATDEVPGARLKIRFGREEYETVTDDEGYFDLSIEHNIKLQGEEAWHPAEVELVDAPIPFDPPITSTAHIFVPAQDAEFGIISDMDDTVIESFATNKLKMARTVIFKNAYSRMPFEGVAAFYRALQLGADGKGINPLFYVSSSPWNLYDFLMDFLDVHDIPMGPLMLVDKGVDREHFGGKGHKAHKFAQIDRILRTYPKMKFILIGDSGQKDPLIYNEIIKKYPDRILTAYIRDVKLPERAKVVLDLAEGLTGKTEMLLIENTLKAAEHALESGYIEPFMMGHVEVAKAVDNSEEVDKMSKKAPEEVVEDVHKEIHDPDKKKELKREIEEAGAQPASSTKSV